MAESPQPANPDGGPLQLIILLDDDLRRTFFSERLVREIHQEENRQQEEKITLKQRVARSGQAIKGVGRATHISPFDEYGRRIFSISTMRGPVDVVQGITELTPRWSKVEGISHVWDMRLATNSIPRDALEKILQRQIKTVGTQQDKIDQYKKIARFYLQAEYYEDARRTLDELLAEHPDLKQQLEPSLRAMTQLSAQRLARELQLRRDAGQYQFVADKLKRFPTENVGGEILQGIREMLDRHQTGEARRRSVVEHLKKLAQKIPDTIQRENLKPILAEMGREIDHGTLNRMAAFLQNADDPKLPDDDKLALAISGWVLGRDAATEQLPKAVAAYRVRDLIREYLRTTSATERARILDYIKKEKSVDLQTVADLLANMKPPLDPTKPDPKCPGFHEMKTPGLPKAEKAAEKVTYYVQLPPEYDPYRRYPTIVTLNAAITTPRQQLDWWAGSPDASGKRSGQASRHGYIVIAPVWTEEGQKTYNYSPREHAAVLNSLRDAIRRFAIDTDRVFLSGHAMGGDAAWDIGLAHPDLWAGVIPVAAQADRYCTFYWENAKYVPFYVVAGELDGGKQAHNARDLDRYLRRGFDATVIEYLGRGHEDFYEEILHVFDWMGHYRRNFYPREFVCETLRPGDNYFWWIETQGLPPRSIVEPADWPPAPGTQPAQIKAAINIKNGINVRVSTSEATVWLSPKMIDFKQRSIITVNGRRWNAPDGMVRPSLSVLLEDVRTRGDRLHPFWARLDGPTGRKPAEDNR